ncbi:hypothetical protein DFJ77DRAFT_430533 [Powellomyces hirtus]|nr:hypothetical protein DFJ77DRAFT_430533 [Powellomyces hirtus]
MHLPTATRRLLRDYTEVSTCPIDRHISAHPLDSTIYEWHANLRNPTNTNLTLHLVLVFPKSYPLQPPSVTLCTPIPHANVVQSLGGYRICLDMLDSGKMDPYEGWSSCYTVASVLRQLQAFIFDPSFQFTQANGDMRTALHRAQTFECGKCTHSFAKPWPSFPTKEDMKKKAPVVVIRRRAVPRNQQMQMQKKMTEMAPAAEPFVWKSVAVVNSVRETEEWTVVQSRRRTGKMGVVGEEKKIKKTDDVVIPTSLSELQALQVALPVTAKPADTKDGNSAAAHERDPLLATTPASIRNAGRFSKLPYEVILHIAASSILSATDVLRLSQTCRHMYTVCQDGHLWRSLFKQRHGQGGIAATASSSSITAAGLADWKTAFALEVNCVTEEMRCFATKLTWEEDVLGVPVTYTINPKTKAVDYISCQVELLSRSAFHTDKVRTTVWNEKFTEWMPLYITQEHFLRARPDIERFMVKMSPERGTSIFRPDMALDVLAKMMNTLIVLLCDKGIAASSHALEGYFLLHRLMAAFVDTYPALQNEVENRIGAFVMGTDNNRHKNAVPSLGHLLPLLTVSRVFKWSSASDPRVQNAFLGELADRSVLWVCAKFPHLAKIPAGPCRKPDMELLKNVWSAGLVSRRLIMFHVHAMGYMDSGFARCSEVLYGRTPKLVVDEFQSHTKRMLNIDFWPHYYQACGVAPVPTPQQSTAHWWQAVRNSLRKGYHTRGMDFSRVHRSGVSSILLKGESFSAPPDLETVVMEETWRWGTDHTAYLDATCSVFDFKNQHMEHITYCNTWGQEGCIIHSGDLIDNTLRQGTHTITINVRKLSKKVKSMVFCMSGYYVPLTDIKQPTVKFQAPDRKDETTMTPLCQYNFLPTTSLGAKTNIVMCVLWRRTPTDRWQVKALGSIGNGCAGNFGPMMPDMRRALVELQ